MFYLDHERDSLVAPAGTIDAATDLRSGNSSGLKRGGKLSMIAVTAGRRNRYANTRCHRARAQYR